MKCKFCYALKKDQIEDLNYNFFLIDRNIVLKRHSSKLNEVEMKELIKMMANRLRFEGMTLKNCEDSLKHHWHKQLIGGKL